MPEALTGLTEIYALPRVLVGEGGPGSGISDTPRTRRVEVEGQRPYRRKASKPVRPRSVQDCTPKTIAISSDFMTAFKFGRTFSGSQRPSSVNHNRKEMEATL